MQPESSKNTGPTCDGGETCELSRQNRSTIGESTLFAGASPVRTLVHATTKRRALTVTDQDCGLSLSGSFGHFGRDSSLLKTSQHSLFGGLIEFSGALPRAGMMRNGTLFRRNNLALHINAIDFSLWPTPLASDWRRMGLSLGAHLKQQFRNKTRGYGCGPASGNLVMHSLIEFGGLPTANFFEWLMNFPVNWTDIESPETLSSPS